MCQILVNTTKYRGCPAACNTTSYHEHKCHEALARPGQTMCPDAKSVPQGGTTKRDQCPNHQDEGYSRRWETLHKPTSRKMRTEKPFVVRVVAVLRHNACYDMRENLVGFKTDVYRGLKVKELRTIVWTYHSAQSLSPIADTQNSEKREERSVLASWHARTYSEINPATTWYKMRI